MSWRSSTVEHLICNQAVEGASPFASIFMDNMTFSVTPIVERKKETSLNRDFIKAKVIWAPENPSAIAIGDYVWAKRDSGFINENGKSKVININFDDIFGYKRKLNK